MTSAVIDASIAIKWVIHEQGSDEANAIRRAGNLAAPDLLLVECANVLWKWQRRGGLNKKECALALDLLSSTNIELVPTRMVVDKALRLASQLDHPVYDCLYLALALETSRPLVTAYRRFAERVEASGIAPGRVQLLGG